MDAGACLPGLVGCARCRRSLFTGPDWFLIANPSFHMVLILRRVQSEIKSRATDRRVFKQPVHSSLANEEQVRFAFDLMSQPQSELFEYLAVIRISDSDFGNQEATERIRYYSLDACSNNSKDYRCCREVVMAERHAERAIGCQCRSDSTKKTIVHAGNVVEPNCGQIQRAQHVSDELSAR